MRTYEDYLEARIVHLEAGGCAAVDVVLGLRQRITDHYSHVRSRRRQAIQRIRVGRDSRADPSARKPLTTARQSVKYKQRTSPYTDIFTR